MLLYVNRDVAVAKRRHSSWNTLHCFSCARIILGEPTTTRSKRLARQSDCHQDRWLLNVAARGACVLNQLNWRREAMSKNTLLEQVVLGDLDRTNTVMRMCVCERADATIIFPEHDGRGDRSRGTRRRVRDWRRRRRVVCSRQSRRRRAEQRRERAQRTYENSAGWPHREESFCSEERTREP